MRVTRFASNNFDIDTGSGGIRVELTKDIEFARINTGSGSVNLTTTRDLGAEVTIETGSGGIEFDAPVQMIERRKDYMRGRVGDGRGKLTVNTGSGGVSFRSN